MENNKQHKELELLYETSVKDIAFFKKQQWFVTYYALLAYGALVSVAKLKLVPSALLMAAACGLALISSLLLSNLEYSIHVRRARLRAIHFRFTKTFNDAWDAKKKEKEYFLVLLCLLFAVVIGAIITTVAIHTAGTGN